MSTKGTLVLTTGLALIVALAVLAWLVFWAFGDGSSSVAGIGPAGSNNGSSEGIQVHGHWTIEVREPDGSLVSLHEFDNALTTGGFGNLVLARLLSGDKAAGLWNIDLENTNPALNVCKNASGAKFTCELHEPRGGSPGPHQFFTLGVTIPNSGADANRLVLQGTATAAVDGQINRVKTFLGTCPTSVAPQGCNINTIGSFDLFTRTILAPSDVPSILAGQQITVKVVIRFS